MNDRPRFTSISLYNHAQGHLSFWYPTEWQVTESAAPHVTVTLLPDPTDPATNMTIEVKNFPGPILLDDRPAIVEGVKAGLAQLAECVLERWRELGGEGRVARGEQKTGDRRLETGDWKLETGDWGLEWLCTFVDGGERRKRRARLFFTRRHLYSVICQGRTEAHYGYWQGMFEYVLLTVGVNQFSPLAWAAQQAWEEL
ncbi:MAG: hypothetical protein R3C14_20665 [Caldilineaceae bacterium]